MRSIMKAFASRCSGEIHIADRMGSALAAGEFIVYFQPKVSPYTGEIEAAEALVRWKTSEGKMIMPGEFIPVFEKEHLIGRLDQYAFLKRCADLCRIDIGREPG